MEIKVSHCVIKNTLEERNILQEFLHIVILLLLYKYVIKQKIIYTDPIPYIYTKILAGTEYGKLYSSI